MGDEKHMHTVETAVVVPLLLSILLGGIFLPFKAVELIEVQNQLYERTEVDVASCVDVLRITEVVYETIESFTQS